MFIYFDLLVFLSFFFQGRARGRLCDVCGFGTVGPRCRMAVGRDLSRIRDWPSLARGSWEGTGGEKGKGHQINQEPEAGGDSWGNQSCREISGTSTRAMSNGGIVGKVL